MQFEARIGRFSCKIQRDCGASLRLDSMGRWSSARINGQMFRRTLPGEVVQLTGPDPFTVVDSAQHHHKIAVLAEEFSRQLPGNAAIHDARNLVLNEFKSRSLGRTASQARGSTLPADAIRCFSDKEHQPPKLSSELPEDEVLRILSLAANWTAQNYQEEARRFQAAYPEAVEILPPDRYGDLVLLPALGCPNSTCSFCSFYRERRFRLVSTREFEEHIEAVCTFMGESLGNRDGIFLGSASALSLSQRILLRRLELVREILGTPRRGVAAFWDPDHCPERGAADWNALAKAGLSAAYLGLETGLPALRQNIGKSADIETLLGRVASAKEGGVHVGVMVLAGIGTPEQFDQHCEATASTVEAMALESTDIVFVSPLLGARPKATLNSEAERLHRALSQATRAQIAPYAAERFHYYA